MTGLSCFLKTILCPFILPFEAARIYFWGCLHVYKDRIFRGRARAECAWCFGGSDAFNDAQFPANAKSIGAWNGYSDAQIDSEVEWKRVAEIIDSNKHGTKLFSDGVRPSDICQGQVGDCYLLSTLACLADRPGGIQRAFITEEYNSYGKYKLRLYDNSQSKFVTVVVDDQIPCLKSTGKPVFAAAMGDAWVMILEKAMAKFKGSYALLDKGSTLWAMQTLTGDYVFKYMVEATDKGPLWRRYEMVHCADKTAGSKTLLQAQPEQLNLESMFSVVVSYADKLSIVGASTGAGSDQESKEGIVQGHAYSVMQAEEVEGFRMIRLRNPWGTFEWQGDWCDSSPLWQQHPKVAAKLNFSAAAQKDDGAFWIEFGDFSQFFKNLDFCYRPPSGRDLVLDVHEEMACCGPTWGCMSGCASFWCCCQGCKMLFSSGSQQQEVVPV